MMGRSIARSLSAMSKPLRASVDDFFKQSAASYLPTLDIFGAGLSEGSLLPINNEGYPAEGFSPY